MQETSKMVSALNLFLDMFEGYGTITSKKGNSYEGNFHKGQKHGEGHHIDKRGNRTKVTYENGEQVE